MKMNKKGFTLIELLAVIVILAVIALIASPIVLGIINNSRKSSQARSVESFATAVQQAYATAMSVPGYMGQDIYILPGTGDTEKDKVFACGGDSVSSSSTTCPADAKIREEVKYSGNVVTCGTNNAEIYYEQETGYIRLENCSVAGSNTKFRYYNAPSDSGNNKTTHGAADEVKTADAGA